MEQTGKKNDTRQHLGVDLIHVAQEFAELLRSVAMEVVDADQNKCGGGPARRAYPLPESSWIAHLELKPGVEIVRIQSQV